MGKSPGKWLKVLLGTNSTKGSSEEKSPKTEKKLKEKRRWSFGRRPLHSKGLDFCLDSRSLSSSFNEGGAVVDEHSNGTNDLDSAPSTSHKVLFNASEEDSSTARKTKNDAVILIQTAFRGYLARRAMGSLKGLVRLQALVRGHLVRRQAGMTLRYVQALVRVQSRVRNRRLKMSEEAQPPQDKLEEQRQRKRQGTTREVWDSRCGTVQELRAKTRSREEAAAKRERALAYAFSRQGRRSAKKRSLLVMDCEQPDEPNWGWSWLEHWMASRPWETARMEDGEENPIEANKVPLQQGLEEIDSDLSSRSRDSLLSTPDVNFQKRKPTDRDLAPEHAFNGSSADPMQGGIDAGRNSLDDRGIASERHSLSSQMIDPPPELADNCADRAEPQMIDPPELADNGVNRAEPKFALSSSMHYPEGSALVSKSGKVVEFHSTELPKFNLSPPRRVSTAAVVVGPSRGSIVLKMVDPCLSNENTPEEEPKSKRKGAKRLGGHTWKSTIMRRSLSGPLRETSGAHNGEQCSPIPSYMASTRSYLAKARSQSNPKGRPESQDEKTSSPASKRRSSLPVESKQMVASLRNLRSSSIKGASCLL